MHRHLDVGGDGGSEREGHDHPEARHERMTQAFRIGLSAEKHHQDSEADQNLQRRSQEASGAFA